MLEKIYGTKFSPKQINANSVSDDLLSAGNGARSIVNISDLGGTSGHVVNAVNYNGTVAFIDFQSGRLFVSKNLCTTASSLIEYARIEVSKFNSSVLERKSPHHLRGFLIPMFRPHFCFSH
jgi:hypothetical protein